MTAAAIRIQPQPGPQTAFASTRADICIFGGSAGCGKSWSLAAEAGRVALRRGRAVLFRREAVELVGGGSLWEETQFYAGLGARSTKSPMAWYFPRGGLVELRHLQLEESKFAHQGKQYDLIGFDELTHFTKSQFWYLYSRARSVSGRVIPYVRATCNPDPDSWVRQLVDWWIGEDGFPIPERSGVLRWFVRHAGEIVWVDEGTEGAQSLTFIPALLEHNRILTARDPAYRSKLEALEEVDRARLLLGNWNARDTSTRVYQYDDRVHGVDELPRDYDRLRWVHSIGVDFGLVNECAWTVTAAHPHRRDAYFVESFKRAELLPEQAAEITADLARGYEPDVIVGDAGGLGKPYVVAHNSRFPGFPMRAADKTEKRAHIKIFNGELKAGRVLVLRHACQAWIREAQSLPWADEYRVKEHKGYPNHCTDSGLYSHRALPAYLHEPAVVKPPPQRSADDEALIEEEARRLIADASRPWWDR
jgi:hypothetical protein